jgi:hypothetical protein
MSATKLVDGYFCDSDEPTAWGLLATLEAAGFVIVPKEPTEAILEAGYERWVTHHPNMDEIYPNERAAWNAMIAAASRET